MSNKPMNMKMTIGAYENEVTVRVLTTKKFLVDNKEVNEIVNLVVDLVEPPNLQREGNSIMLHLGKGAADMENAYFIPYLDEFRIFPVKSNDSTRLTFVRDVKDVIMFEDDENDSEDIKKIKEAERKKQSRISPAYNLIFLNSLKRVPFEVKQKVYNFVYNLMPTPFVPNMLEPTVLAGQLFVDKTTAKQVLDTINGLNKYPIHTTLIERAKYLIKVYEKWVTEVFDIMKEEGLLRPLDVIVSSSKNKKKPYEVIVDEKIIEPLIQEKCASGVLYFTPNAHYDEITNFNQYMAYIAKMMKSRIESIAKPIHRWNDIPQEIMDKFPLLLRMPFEAQRNGITAAIKALDRRGNVTYVAEMGTGKSLMMTSTAWIDADLQGETLKLLILCPDHLVDTVWEEEINKTVNDVTVHKVTSVNDLREFEERGYLDDKVKRAFVLGQKFSKMTYSYKPAVNWGLAKTNFMGTKMVDKNKKAFSCPCCGEQIMKKTRELDELTNEIRTVYSPAPFTYFDTMNYGNYACKKCDTPLWEPITKTNREKSIKEKKFIYSGELKGFYPNDKQSIRAELSRMKGTKSNYSTNSSEYKNISKRIEYFEKLFDIAAGNAKEGVKRTGTTAPVAYYIFKKLRYRFSHLIVDELHEYGGESKRGEACDKLVNSVRKVIAGTGTIMNGYADSIFRLAFMFQPEKLKAAGYTINDMDKFQADYGVVERKYALVEKNGKKKREAWKPMKRPGISPLIFPYFMQDNCVFVSMDDMNADMPELEHYNIPVEMDEALKKAHKDLVTQIKNKTYFDKKAFKNTVSLNYSFLDTPTKKKYLYDEDGNVLIETPVIDKYEDKKLGKLIEVCKDEIVKDGRRMMIYTNYSSDNINGYLQENLLAEGYKVTILNPVDQKSISCDGSEMKVAADEREKFIRKEVLKGVEILIVNPELVKTGCNLLDFPTILYYQMGYKVFTNRQADRRSWRLGQTQVCKVMYLYYEESIQEQVASLMATKIVASRSIEGHMDEDGLHALANDRTAEEELSSMFYNGIKDKVKGLKTYKAVA